MKLKTKTQERAEQHRFADMDFYDACQSSGGSPKDPQRDKTNYKHSSAGRTKYIDLVKGYYGC